MREFGAGVADLGRGFRLWGTSPRLMLLGAVPAAIVGVVWLALLVLLALRLDAIVAALTPFADGWGGLAWPVRLLAGAALLAVALLLAILTFTAVVLTVGAPFYDRISAAVERRLGDPPAEADEPWLQAALRAARDGIALLAASLPVGLVAFLLGLVPVAGAALALVFGATVGGRLLVVELTATPFDARGVRLRERRGMLRRHRARVLGFGAATWLVFLIPFAAVVAMPAAVAGATVLARRVLDADGRAEPR